MIIDKEALKAYAERVHRDPYQRLFECRDKTTTQHVNPVPVALQHMQQGDQLVYVLDGKEYILELVNIKEAEIG